MNNTGEALKTVDTSASIIFFPELNVMAIITFAAEESEGQRGQVTLQKVKGSRIFFFFFFFGEPVCARSLFLFHFAEKVSGFKVTQ